MGNKAEYFPFTIKVDTVPGMTTEKFEGKIDLTHADATVPAETGRVQQTNPDKITLTGGTGTATIWLQHDQYFSVTLPEGATYTVSEPVTDYDVTYVINEEKPVQGKSSLSGTLTGNTKVEFKNNKNTSVPTGIYDSITPALAGIGITGLFLAVFFLGRRRRNILET